MTKDSMVPFRWLIVFFFGSSHQQLLLSIFNYTKIYRTIYALSALSTFYYYYLSISSFYVGFLFHFISFLLVPFHSYYFISFANNGFKI